MNKKQKIPRFEMLKLQTNQTVFGIDRMTPPLLNEDVKAV